MDEVWHHIVLLLLLRQEAVVVLPVILVHASVEGSRRYRALFTLFFLSLILLVLQEHGVLVREPLIVTEEIATRKRRHLRLRLPPEQVTILFIVHHFGNGVRE